LIILDYGADRGGAGLVTIEDEEYMTATEAARALGVKPATLYAYVSRGFISSYREGMRRRRLYRRADVLALGRLRPARAPAHELPRAEDWIPLTG
jgi:citrate synthase